LIVPSPPEQYRWKPGQSGNPKGRPPNIRTLTERMRGLLDETRVGKTDLPDGMTVADAIARVLVNGALKGDVRLLAMVVDRLDGRVPDALVVSGSADAPIKVLVEYADPAPPDDHPDPAPAPRGPAEDPGD
jgi:hypothetical protein